MSKLLGLIHDYISQRIDLPIKKCIKLAAGKLYLTPRKACQYRNYLIHSMLSSNKRMSFQQALGLTDKSVPQRLLILARFLNPITLVLFTLASIRVVTAGLIDSVALQRTDAAELIQQSHWLGRLLKLPFSLLFIIEAPLTRLFHLHLFTRLFNRSVKSRVITPKSIPHSVDKVTNEPVMTLAIAAQLEYQLDYQPAWQHKVQELTSRGHKIKETIQTLRQVTDMKSTETYKKLQSDMQQILNELEVIQQSHETHALQQADMIFAPMIHRREIRVSH